jgi:hypothetical protein
VMEPALATREVAACGLARATPKPAHGNGAWNSMYGESGGMSNLAYGNLRHTPHPFGRMTSKKCASRRFIFICSRLGKPNPRGGNGVKDWET